MYILSYSFNPDISLHVHFNLILIMQFREILPFRPQNIQDLGTEMGAYCIIMVLEKTVTENGSSM